MEGTGLYAYGFRYYDPVIGRFTGVDPIAEQFAFVSPFNYAENRPISGVDLHGLQYVDAEVKMKIDREARTISLNGTLDVKMKIINMSSSRISYEAKKHHERKASRSLDMLNTYSGSGMVPLDPESSGWEPLQGRYRVSGSLNINLEFAGKFSSLNALQNGDVGLILVDEVLDDKPGVPKLAVTHRGGYAIIMEISAFNELTNIGAHEFGHLVGDLGDNRDGKPVGNLMTLPISKSSYKLRTSQYMEILNNMIYRMGTSGGNIGDSNHNTKKDAEGLIKDHTKR
jgi:hypothetical protein